MIFILFLFCFIFKKIGKTHFTLRIIENARHIFEQPPAKIIYAYGVHQEAFDSIEKMEADVIMHEGLPAEDFLQNELDTTRHNLVILDDLIDDIGRSKEMCNLFIRGVHHKKISVILLYQNIFFQSKYMRTISLNLFYYVLMKTYRDKVQIMHLAKQMFPDNPKRMMEAYEDCVANGRGGYLVVTNVPTAQEEDRLATLIFPGETLTMYYPK